LKVILSKSNSSAINLAGEEYLFHTFTDDIFYLYINSPSIIVGRKQNTLAEINYEYVTANNIPVIRRMTGGGAVYHDLGNLNFCFIIRNVKNIDSDFSQYTKPILMVLNELSIDARLEGRNDLTIDGRKFSGNAKYFSKGNLLQHGTLLFNSELGSLSKALKSNPLKFEDKAVKSIQARVTNISEHLKTNLSLNELANLLINKVISLYTEAGFYAFDDDDIKQITKLTDDKYNTYEWNYGKSPNYNFSKTLKTKGGNIQLSMDVSNGIIKKAQFYGDFFMNKDLDTLETVLAGTAHEFEAIQRLLHSHSAEDYFMNITNDELLSLFF
jgi:lipoate-protein ligase A